MGRRQTASTKSGKYMNPADQARKEQRKRELKKNKKTRVAVRQAVLKSKDPTDVIIELEKLDDMEFSAQHESFPKLHERVIQEKRRKLEATYRRVLKMYEEDDKAEWSRLKAQYQEYEKRKNALVQHAYAVKFAEETNPAEIPLPTVHDHLQINPYPLMVPGMPFFGLIPPPPMGTLGKPFAPDLSRQPSHSILKKTLDVSLPSSVQKARKEPPGPPPGYPPDLSDSDDESDGLEPPRGSRVRFETDADDKDSRSKYKELAKMIGTADRDVGEFDQPEIVIPDRPLGYPPAIPPVVMRPPPAMRMPPGVPRLVRPPPPPLGLPPRLGPPRGPPPAMGFLPRPQLRPQMGVVSAPATLRQMPTVDKPADGKGHEGPIIQATPQLRNMAAEVTKLVPVAVKVKREPLHMTVRGKPVSSGGSSVLGGGSFESGPKLMPPTGQRTKDDAYDQFMKEMSGLL